MVVSMPEPLPIPIRERISQLLAGLGQTPGWLADKAGVERSTVKRIVDGQRNPTAETLATLAPILGVTLDELVASTDAAGRIDGVRRLVDRSYLEDALRQLFEQEQKATNLSRLLRESQDAEEKERKRRKEADAALEATVAELSLTTRKLETAQQSANRFEQDAEKYRRALGRAFVEIAQLKTSGEELAQQAKKLASQVGDTKILAGVAAFFAAATAAMKLADLFKDEPKSSEDAPATNTKAGGSTRRG